MQPLITGNQSGAIEFTMSTIKINGGPYALPMAIREQSVASAFVVQEGQLSLTIFPYPPVTLEVGDVAFIPGNTTYQYWSQPYSTKVVYVSGGHQGLDYQLIQGGKTWDFVTYPVN